jgi:hypothetical protein
MQNNLNHYAMGGVTIKRFTYERNGNNVQCKPKPSEKFVLVEDYLGDRSLIWIACFENGAEKWRHNVSNVVRITFDEPIKID